LKKSINVGSTTVALGTSDHGILSVPNVFADGMSVEIPFMILNGAHDGPRLHVQVAQHGVEINGLEAIRRVFSEIKLDNLKGAITYCLPNPIAFRESRTVMSYDDIPGGMNRVWPGNPRGSLTNRMVHEIWTNLIKGKAEYLIDFHTGRRNAPVWVFYEAHGVSPGVSKDVADKSERMARVFGAEMLYLETEAYGGGNTCRGVAVDNGIPGIVPEIGGASHFDPDHVNIAYQGLKNIMIDLGMIQGKIELPKKQIVLKWVMRSEEIAAVAPKGGVFLPKVKIGDKISIGDAIGIIYSPRTFKEIAEVVSPKTGVIFSIIENPIVVAGQPVAQVPEIIKEIIN